MAKIDEAEERNLSIEKESAAKDPAMPPPGASSRDISNGVGASGSGI
jgi:hypothetical protein